MTTSSPGATLGGMFDVDNFLDACVAARADASPHAAIRDVLAAACSDPSAVLAALPAERAEIVALHVSPDLTVLNVVWAPGMSFRPHDHRMWSAIGIYSGGEDNTFYRRQPRGLVESGGRSLRPTDVCLLGDDTIHAVTNPTSAFAGAIHVYGGDLLATPRSEWTPDTFEEQPYDVVAMRAAFDEYNSFAATD